MADVEDALRQMHDYSYPGQHALANLAMVDRALAERDCGIVAHIDRGWALSRVLLQAMDKLRPAGLEPKPLAIPSREWHQFLVLHAAYLDGEPNRDIMSRLYIGEGTFSRTRRRVLRGMARALQEMEGEAIQRQA